MKFLDLLKKEKGSSYKRLFLPIRLLGIDKEVKLMEDGASYRIGKIIFIYLSKDLPIVGIQFGGKKQVWVILSIKTFKNLLKNFWKILEHFIIVEIF